MSLDENSTPDEKHGAQDRIGWVGWAGLGGSVFQVGISFENTMYNTKILYIFILMKTQIHTIISIVASGIENWICFHMLMSTLVRRCKFERWKFAKNSCKMS